MSAPDPPPRLEAAQARMYREWLRLFSHGPRHPGTLLELRQLLRATRPLPDNVLRRKTLAILVQLRYLVALPGQEQVPIERRLHYAVKRPYREHKRR